MALVLFGLVGGWALSGVVTAALLARHGHNFWLLALIGLGYGPLTGVIFARGFAGQDSSTTRTQSGGAVHSDGWLDVLVGLDGSDASVESVREVVRALGPAVKRLRLASVIDHEVSNAPDGFELDDKRWESLQRAASYLDIDEPDLVLVSGQPDKALASHAVDEDFDLIVVAHRRNFARSGLRGSTSGRLARSAPVPVLIGPPHDDGC